MASFNHFPEIAAKFPLQLHNVVVQTADIVREIAANNAPKRTGFMADSIYTVSSDGSSYGQGMAPPTDDVYLLPPLPMPSDPFEASAAVAANYSAFVEFGTRYMAAQPYFYPAVEEGRARLDAALAAMASFL